MSTDPRIESMDVRPKGRDNPERLEREIDATRAHLGETVDALSERLSPGQLLDQALGVVRRHGGEFGRNLGADVKHNPLPLLLTGVGITWMMASTGASNRHSYTTRTADGTADSTDGDARSAARRAADRTRHAAAGARERVGDMKASVREGAHSMQHSLEDLLYGQPLLAGSLGVALGAALGAMIPPTETEDELMGRTSDRAVEKAKHAASDKYEEVRRKADDTDRP